MKAHPADANWTGLCRGRSLVTNTGAFWSTPVRAAVDSSRPRIGCRAGGFPARTGATGPFGTMLGPIDARYAYRARDRTPACTATVFWQRRQLNDLLAAATIDSGAHRRAPVSPTQLLIDIHVGNWIVRPRSWPTDRNCSDEPPTTRSTGGLAVSTYLGRIAAMPHARYPAGPNASAGKHQRRMGQRTHRRAECPGCSPRWSRPAGLSGRPAVGGNPRNPVPHPPIGNRAQPRCYRRGPHGPISRLLRTPAAAIPHPHRSAAPASETGRYDDTPAMLHAVPTLLWLQWARGSTRTRCRGPPNGRCCRDCCSRSAAAWLNQTPDGTRAPPPTSSVSAKPPNGLHRHPLQWPAIVTALLRLHEHLMANPLPIDLPASSHRGLTTAFCLKRNGRLNRPEIRRLPTWKRGWSHAEGAVAGEADHTPLAQRRRPPRCGWSGP